MAHYSAYNAANSTLYDRLPLSWRWLPAGASACFKRCRLHLHAGSWLTLADVAADCLDVWHTAAEPSLVRGVPARLAQQLRSKGWQLLPQGIEIIMPPRLQPLQDSSLRALVNRGLRKVEISPYHPLDTQAARMHHALMHSHVHAHKATLRHLYRTDIALCDVLWVARARSATAPPVAALTLTRNGTQHWHIEQMLRLPDAPAGCMEALIVHAHRQLAQQGYALSLGEVPFCPLHTASSVAGVVSRLGRRLAYAYPAHSLLAFKQKFGGIVQPLYLACNHGAPVRALPEMFIACGLAARCGQALLGKLGLGGHGRGASVIP